MPLSPEKHFTMIRLQCADDVLSTWDAVVQREEGLRVIDVFKGIWETYRISLTMTEKTNNRALALSPECEAAFDRRSMYISGSLTAILRRGLSRVDLLGNR
ncbi:hypothetical protein H0H93_002988, partial [Arthromyces matolae]